MSEAPIQGWPATLAEHWAWHMQAACRELDSGLFFSPEGERGPRKTHRERAAKAVCASCPVLDVCAAYALATREPYGTWGGLSENDRRHRWRSLDPAGAQLAYRLALAAFQRRTAGPG